MPYIEKERVAQIRAQIKKEFPQYKISVTRRDHHAVSICILSAPIDMLKTSPDRKYEQVNQFYIAEHYQHDEQTRDVLLRIYSIANEGNGTEVEDGDYGTVPDFYVDISIGNFERPFTVIEAKSEQAQAHVAIKAEGVSIIDYSERSVAVVGNTYPIKDQLKNMGGKFNRFLSCGAGWIFPKSKQQELSKFVS